MAKKVSKFIITEEDNILLEFRRVVEDKSPGYVTSEWIDISPPNSQDREVPKHALAMLFDVRDKKGTVRIFRAKDDYYLGGVDHESGTIIMVPWNDDWNYSCVGKLRAAYVYIQQESR